MFDEICDFLLTLSRAEDVPAVYRDTAEELRTDLLLSTEAATPPAEPDKFPRLRTMLPTLIEAWRVYARERECLARTSSTWTPGLEMRIWELAEGFNAVADPAIRALRADLREQGIEADDDYVWAKGWRANNAYTLFGHLPITYLDNLLATGEVRPVPAVPTAERLVTPFPV